MNQLNHMQDKVLSALRSIVDAWELEWVEILGGPFQGTIRLMKVGSFRTLQKIVYEFQPERFRLLVYRDGRHIFGRCNMDYDDGILIEQFLSQFGSFTAESLLDPPQRPRHDTTFRRSLCQSLAQHA